MALEYKKLDTFWHNLDSRTKLLWSILVILQLAVWTDPVWQLATLVIIVVPGLISRTPWRQLKTLLLYMLPFTILLIVLEAFFYNPSYFSNRELAGVIFSIGPFRATIGGLLFGLNIAEKLFFAVLFVAVLSFTVPFTDLLYMFQKVGLPHQLTFVMATSLRIAPLYQRLYREITDAQKARGWSLEGAGLIEKLRRMMPVLVPLFGHALNMTERLALAMESRAFGYTKKPTIPVEYVFKTWDYIVISVIIVLIALTVYTMIAGLGQL